MPRVSYQTFTDSNTKVVNAYGGDGSGGGKQGKVVVNKVEFTTGSSAGAGSGEFHKYLGARNREKERMEEIDRVGQLEEEKRAFSLKVQQNKLEADERTRKNAEKRKKKKEKEAQRKKMRKTEDSNGIVISASNASNGHGEKEEDKTGSDEEGKEEDA